MLDYEAGLGKARSLWFLKDSKGNYPAEQREISASTGWLYFRLLGAGVIIFRNGTFLQKGSKANPLLYSYNH